MAGSTVKAGGALTADAAGDVNVHSAQNSHDSSTTTETRGFDAYAKSKHRSNIAPAFITKTSNKP